MWSVDLYWKRVSEVWHVKVSVGRSLSTIHNILAFLRMTCLTTAVFCKWHPSKNCLEGHFFKVKATYPQRKYANITFSMAKWWQWGEDYLTADSYLSPSPPLSLSTLILASLFILFLHFTTIYDLPRQSSDPCCWYHYSTQPTKPALTFGRHWRNGSICTEKAVLYENIDQTT